jgi:Flp pilus assembly pilin Flp
MRTWLKTLSGLKTRRGQTTAEYAIIVALVAVSCIAIILIFGDQIRALFAGEANKLGGGDGSAMSGQLNTKAGEANTEGARQHKINEF